MTFNKYLIAGTLLFQTAYSGELNYFKELPKAAQGTIEKFKASPRGPYEKVMWFCRDGQVLPPKSYACKNFGGGKQYGLLTDEAKKLQESGLFVGTIFSSLKSKDLKEHQYYRARAYLIESFLENQGHGWVLASAKGYRGFRQVEDEEITGTALYKELLSSKTFLEDHTLLALRFLKVLPGEIDQSFTTNIRNLATEISEVSPKYMPLRSKIHSHLQLEDKKELDKCTNSESKELSRKCSQLAQEIQNFFNPKDFLKRYESLIGKIRDSEVKSQIRNLFEVMSPNYLKANHLKVYSAIQALAKEIKITSDLHQKYILLRVLLAAEELLFRASSRLNSVSLTRIEALNVSGTLIRISEFFGYLSDGEIRAANIRLIDSENITASEYLNIIKQRQLYIDWMRGTVLQTLGFALPVYKTVAPDAQLIVDDILRSSVVFGVSYIIDRMENDFARKLSQDEHDIRLPRRGSVKGENSGLTIGPLRIIRSTEDVKKIKRHEVVALDDVPPYLPPVAGIILLGASSSLSHVSLLVRNLGIPFISSNSDFFSSLSSFESKPFVLGVSPKKKVLAGPLEQFSEEERSLLGREKNKDEAFLLIDTGKLDFLKNKVLRLSDLSENDAGVIVGPKAAELARLKRLFPDQVSDALVLPFGVFLQHVQGTLTTESPWKRLQQAFQKVKGMSEAEQSRYLLGELQTFREMIQQKELSGSLKSEVSSGLAKMGAAGRFGVFVRSDTNVEDLKEFTGAGLNLTIPNQVSNQSIFSSIKKVWASPYDERSYQWRQRLLKNPEWVLPSILLHKTVPVDFSGVMVTSHLENGDQNFLTISASEGVAAVVDTGLPESIRVNRSNGFVEVLSFSKSTQQKRIPEPPAEGVSLLPSTRQGRLLRQEHIKELVKISHEIKSKMNIGNHKNTIWDIEFGFTGKKLYLMQIRPLKTKNMASLNPLLAHLEREEKSEIQPILMKEILK